MPSDPLRPASGDAALVPAQAAPWHELPRLIGQVQHNCHVADARHARELSLCNYLLQMRELYRWEQGLPLTATLQRREVGPWLSQREQLWEPLEDAPYEAIELGAERIQPFDVEAINRHLHPRGLAYGAGIGRFGAAHFFLAELQACRSEQGTAVLETGREYARDAATLPGAYQNGSIVLRHDALRRWLWSRIEPWQAEPPEGALRRALCAWGHGEDIAATLDRMAASEVRRILLHELGEAQVEALLGERWGRLLTSGPSRRAELLLRAVRDLLADCLSTLPDLLAQAARGDTAALHFYVANLDGWRAGLFVSLRLGYDRWCQDGRLDDLAQAVALGRGHWLAVAHAALASFEHDAGSALAAFDQVPDQGPHPWGLVVPT